MEVTISTLENYLRTLYSGRVDAQSLFMKLVEEIGETAEVLNRIAGRKASNDSDLQAALGQELCDVIHYAVAIAAINELDLNEILLEKDRAAAQKYHREETLTRFLDSQASEEAVERIKGMEACYDALQAAVNECPEQIHADPALSALAQILAQYYDSGRWLTDYALDERGCFPSGLKRGVLSQDGVYDLLEKIASYQRKAQQD